ncbi:MAG: sigma 54-interacting transcriptional regulator, partial [Planctomycetota bacterium]|nr:sigma 54-interacting transcriptional regulator [Planctomycetota bacterium]
LLEAELFGFVRGAFTDAMEDRAGLLRRADGGTLYLDEIAELTAALQTRLLGVLAQRRVRPLGSDEEVPVDFRLISSTRHVNVEELEANGLRPELFFRLRGQLLVIPPLRERPEDIVLLATHHVASHARLKDGPPPHLPPRTIDKLLAHSWPGNVRELENELTRALVENPRGEIGPELILREGAAPASQPPVVGRPRALREARDAFEREFVLGVLRDSGGNATRAAEALKVTRRHLGKLLEKHAIDLRDLKHAVRPAGPQEKTERGKRRTR